jgi:amylosucrase
MSTGTAHRAAAIAAARNRLAGHLADDPTRVDLLTRYDRWANDLWEGLDTVYDAAVVLPTVVDVIAAVHAARSSVLRQRDRERVLRPDWFQSADAIGYVAYADLFAGDLQGIRQRIDYLTGPGVTYLHPMPLLTPRAGENDGG